MNKPTKILFAVTAASIFGIALYVADEREAARVANAPMVIKTRPAAEPTPTRDEPTSDELNGAAGCLNNRIVVENRSSDVWEDARIVLNGDWRYSPGVITPGKQPFMPALFTKNDGTRLNLLTVACKNIGIYATVRGKRMNWFGAY